MAKRFLTYFKVPIPPWKEKKLGAGSTTIRFVITGRVPSKKNNMQSVAVRREARNYLNELPPGKMVTKQQAGIAIGKVHSKIRPNDDYNEFVAKQLPIIQKQMEEWSGRLQYKGLVFPIPYAALSLRFYMKQKHLSDTVNRQQTIQDLLIACRVVANDDYRTLNPIQSASACYFGEVFESITVISLSFRLPGKL